MSELYISLHGFCDYELNITPDMLEIGGEGDGFFDGFLLELVVEIRKLLCEYVDVDPTIEGFTPPAKIISESS